MEAERVYRKLYPIIKFVVCKINNPCSPEAPGVSLTRICWQGLST